MIDDDHAKMARALTMMARANSKGEPFTVADFEIEYDREDYEEYNKMSQMMREHNER